MAWTARTQMDTGACRPSATLQHISNGRRQGALLRIQLVVRRQWSPDVDHKALADVGAHLLGGKQQGVAAHVDLLHIHHEVGAVELEEDVVVEPGLPSLHEATVFRKVPSTSEEHKMWLGASDGTCKALVQTAGKAIC
jgi:hypothetical protein